MGKIKIAIIGAGNCASSLIQGIEYYKDMVPENAVGLMHFNLGGYVPADIECVAAFDIDKRKVGRDLSEAIFAPPNCTTVFCGDIPKSGVEVKMGPVMDGYSGHMENYPDEQTFLPADTDPVDVVEEIKKSEAEILVNYLPVGSENAAKHYAQCALDAGVGFVNNIPVFIASDETWAKKFTDAGLPIVGDDIKAQVGATITHRVLTRLFQDRGVKLERTYQLNTGGNTDFLNMKEHSRLASKKISKTDSVQSQLEIPMHCDDIHIGPSDYVPWQKDNKVCFIRMEGKKFGGVPINLELRLSVEDSPNSGGVAIDAIRCCKLGLERKIAGPLTSISSYTMKHPPIQYTDSDARQKVLQYIKGEISE